MKYLRPCQFISALIFIGSNLIEISDACNGYTLKVNKVSNCIENSVMKITSNPGATLDADCNLILRGCLESKGYKTAKGKYTVKKAPMPPMEGDLDFCQAAADASTPQLDILAKMYNVPRNCPVPAGKVCGAPDKMINLSKYKNQLGIAAGTIDAKIEATHDTGKSCIEINLTLSKQRTRG